MVIAVIGRLGSGSAREIARRAAEGAARVELVATADPGPAGDRALGGLADAGIGHAAVLRSTAAALEPADVELALRYLPDVRVVVLAEPAGTLDAAAADAAAWSNAALVVVAAPDAEPRDAEPRRADGPGDLRQAAGAFVLMAPSVDPDGSFAGVVAALAVRLDGGEAPASAWVATTTALGLERVDPAG